MSEKPILFSGPMVRAILAGKKTVTRRVYKPRVPPPYEIVDETDDETLWPFRMDECGDYHERRSPYGNSGDKLWVRETWGSADHYYGEGGQDPPEVVAYRADQSAIQYSAEPPRQIPGYDIGQWNWDHMKWRPSIFMPRWASRLTLAIKSVRIERLQGITEADASAEGVAELDGSIDDAKLCAVAKTIGGRAEDARSWFAYLWDEINGKKHPWSSNPFVWRVEFETIEKGVIR